MFIRVYKIVGVGAEAGKGGREGGKGQKNGMYKSEIKRVRVELEKEREKTRRISAKEGKWGGVVK